MRHYRLAVLSTQKVSFNLLQLPLKIEVAIYFWVIPCQINTDFPQIWWAPTETWPPNFGLIRILVSVVTMISAMFSALINIASLHTKLIKSGFVATENETMHGSISCGHGRCARLWSLLYRIRMYMTLLFIYRYMYLFTLTKHAAWLIKTKHHSVILSLRNITEHEGDSERGDWTTNVWGRLGELPRSSSYRRKRNV